MIRIGFIADVHIGPTGYYKGIRRKFTEYAEELVREFIDHTGGPEDCDFLVQLGDLIEDVNTETDRANYQHRLEVRTLLKQGGKVAAVVNGHLHWNQVNWHDGIPFITVQSATENFDNQGTPARAWGVIELEQDAFRLRQFGKDPFEHGHSFDIKVR